MNWARLGPWLLLACMVGGGLILRMPALHWLTGAGVSPDYSFEPDANRFLFAARNITAPNPDGYPQGMTTQLYLVDLVIQRFAHVGLKQLLQAITLFYSGILIVLTYATARSWRMSRARALLAAALLTLAPLAVVLSNFGTADMAAVSFFYATLLAGGRYLRTRKQLWFVLLCALTGIAVAVKFFIPLFAPLALVLAMQERDKLVAQGLSAVLIVAGSFEAFSMFNYTPSDLHKLYWMLRDDNIGISGSDTGPIRKGVFNQLLLYSWDFVSAAGIPVAMAVAFGGVRWLLTLPGQLARLRSTLLASGWRALVTSSTLFVAALSVHAMLIVSAGECISRGICWYFCPLLASLRCSAFFWRPTWSGYRRWRASLPSP